MGEGTRPTTLGQGTISAGQDVADAHQQPVLAGEPQQPNIPTNPDLYLFGAPPLAASEGRLQNPYNIDFSAKLAEVPQAFRDLFLKLPEDVAYSPEKICIFYQAYQYAAAKSAKPIALTVVQKEFKQTLDVMQYLESRYQVVCEKQMLLDLTLTCLVTGDLQSVNDLQLQLDTVAFDAHCNELSGQALDLEFQLQSVKHEMASLTKQLMDVCARIGQLVNANMNYFDHDQRDRFDDVYSDVSRLESERNDLVEKLAALKSQQQALTLKLQSANQGITLEQYKILKNTKAPQDIVDRYLLSLVLHPEALPESMREDVAKAKARYLAKADSKSLPALCLTDPQAALVKAVTDYNEIQVNEWILVAVNQYEKLDAEYDVSEGGHYEFWEATGKVVPDALYNAPEGFTPVWIQGDGTKTQDWLFVAKQETGYEFQPVPIVAETYALDFEPRGLTFVPQQPLVVANSDIAAMRVQQTEQNTAVQMALFANTSFQTLTAVGDDMLLEVSKLTAMIQHGVVGYTKDEEFLGSLKASASTLMDFYYEHEGTLREAVENSSATLKTLESMAQRLGNPDFAAKIQSLKEQLQTVVAMVEGDQIPELCQSLMSLDDSYDFDQATYFLETTVLITATAVVGGVLCMTGVGAIFGATVFASLPGMLLMACLTGLGGVVGQEVGTAISGDVFDTGLKSHWQRYQGGEISDEELAATYLESWACQSLMTFAFLGAGRVAGVAGKTMSQSANQWTARAGMSILRVGSFIQRGVNGLLLFNAESQLGRFFVTSAREVGSEFIEESFEGAAHQIHPVLGGIASIIDCLDGRNIQVELYGAGVTIAGQFQVPGTNMIVGNASYTAGKKSVLVTELQRLFPKGTVTQSNAAGDNTVTLEFVNEKGQTVKLQFHSSEESYALRLSAANTVLQSGGEIRGYRDLLTNVLGLVPQDEGMAYRVNDNAHLDWLIEQFKMRGMPLVNQNDTVADPYIEIYTGDRVVRIYTTPQLNPLNVSTSNRTMPSDPTTVVQNSNDTTTDLPNVTAAANTDAWQITDYAAVRTQFALVVTIGLGAEVLAVLHKILEEDYGKDELPDETVRIDLVASGLESFVMSEELLAELQELAGEYEVAIDVVYRDENGTNQIAEIRSSSFAGNVAAAIPIAAMSSPVSAPAIRADAWLTRLASLVERTQEYDSGERLSAYAPNGSVVNYGSVKTNVALADFRFRIEALLVAFGSQPLQAAAVAEFTSCMQDILADFLLFLQSAQASSTPGYGLEQMSSSAYLNLCAELQTLLDSCQTMTLLTSVRYQSNYVWQSIDQPDENFPHIPFEWHRQLVETPLRQDAWQSFVLASDSGRSRTFRFRETIVLSSPTYRTLPQEDRQLEAWIDGQWVPYNLVTKQNVAENLEETVFTGPTGDTVYLLSRTIHLGEYVDAGQHIVERALDPNLSFRWSDAARRAGAYYLTVRQDADLVDAVEQILDKNRIDEFSNARIVLNAEGWQQGSLVLSDQQIRELGALAETRNVAIDLKYIDANGDVQVAEFRSEAQRRVDAVTPAMSAASVPLLHPIEDYFALYADDPALQAEYMARVGEQKFVQHQVSSNFELDPAEMDCLEEGNQLMFAEKVRAARAQGSNTISWTVKIFGVGQLGQECGDILQELLPQLLEAKRLGLTVDVKFLGFDVQLYNLNMAEIMATHDLQDFITENNLQDTLRCHFDFQFADLTDPRSATRAADAGHPDITIWRHTWLAAYGEEDDLDADFRDQFGDQYEGRVVEPQIPAAVFYALVARLQANLNRLGVILVAENVGEETYALAEVVRAQPAAIDTRGAFYQALPQDADVLQAVKDILEGYGIDAIPNRRIVLNAESWEAGSLALNPAQIRELNELADERNIAIDLKYVDAHGDVQVAEFRSDAQRRADAAVSAMIAAPSNDVPPPAYAALLAADGISFRAELLQLTPVSELATISGRLAVIYGSPLIESRQPLPGFDAVVGTTTFTATYYRVPKTGIEILVRNYGTHYEVLTQNAAAQAQQHFIYNSAGELVLGLAREGTEPPVAHFDADHFDSTSSKNLQDTVQATITRWNWECAEQEGWSEFTDSVINQMVNMVLLPKAVAQSPEILLPGTLIHINGGLPAFVLSYETYSERYGGPALTVAAAFSPQSTMTDMPEDVSRAITHLQFYAVDPRTGRILNSSFEVQGAFFSDGQSTFHTRARLPFDGEVYEYTHDPANPFEPRFQIYPNYEAAGFDTPLQPAPTTSVHYESNYVWQRRVREGGMEVAWWRDRRSPTAQSGQVTQDVLGVASEHGIEIPVAVQDQTNQRQLPEDAWVDFMLRATDGATRRFRFRETRANLLSSSVSESKALLQLQAKVDGTWVDYSVMGSPLNTAVIFRGPNGDQVLLAKRTNLVNTFASDEEMVFETTLDPNLSFTWYPGGIQQRSVVPEGGRRAGATAFYPWHTADFDSSHVALFNDEGTGLRADLLRIDNERAAIDAIEDAYVMRLLSSSAQASGFPRVVDGGAVLTQSFYEAEDDDFSVMFRQSDGYAEIITYDGRNRHSNHLLYDANGVLLLGLILDDAGRAMVYCDAQRLQTSTNQSLRDVAFATLLRWSELYTTGVTERTLFLESLQTGFADFVALPAAVSGSSVSHPAPNSLLLVNGGVPAFVMEGTALTLLTAVPAGTSSRAYREARHGDGQFHLTDVDLRTGRILTTRPLQPFFSDGNNFFLRLDDNAPDGEIYQYIDNPLEPDNPELRVYPNFAAAGFQLPFVDGPNGREMRSAIPEAGRQLSVTYFDIVRQGLAATLNDVATTLGRGRSLVFTPDTSHAGEAWHWRITATNADTEEMRAGQLRARLNEQGHWSFAEWDDVVHEWVTIEMKVFLANVRGAPNDTLPIPLSWQIPQDTTTLQHPDGLVPHLHDQIPVSQYFPNWPTLILNAQFQIPLNERYVIDVPDGPVIVGIGQMTWQRLQENRPNTVSEVVVGSTEDLGYWVQDLDRPVILVSRNSAAYLEMQVQAQNCDFMGRLTVDVLRTDSAAQERLYDLANQSRDNLTTTLTAVASDVVGAALPIVSLIGAINGPVTQDQFIRELLYQDDPLSEEILVKSSVSIPADHFDETITRLQRDLPGSVLQNNRAGRAIIRYRTPDGVLQQILIEAIHCPLTEQEMQSSELAAERILGIQDEMGGCEVLLVRTAFGHLAVRVGTSDNVSPLEGDKAVLHTHPGAADNDMLMMPSGSGYGDTAIARKAGNQQAILHARGVTLYDGKTIVYDNEDHTERTVIDATLITTLDVIIGIDVEGNVTVRSSNANRLPMRVINVETFYKVQPVVTPRAQGSLGSIILALPSQEPVEYDLATMTVGDVQAMRAHFTSPDVGEDISGIDAEDRFHRVAAFLEKVAQIRPDLLDDVLNIHTDVMVTMALSDSAYDAATSALARIYVAHPDVWAQHNNRDWIMGCLSQGLPDSANAIRVLVMMIRLNPTLFDREDFVALSTDPEVAKETQKRIREEILVLLP